MVGKPTPDGSRLSPHALLGRLLVRAEPRISVQLAPVRFKLTS